MTSEVKLNVSIICHPGYEFVNSTQQCSCMNYRREIVRCDSFNRYFYTRVSCSLVNQRLLWCTDVCCSDGNVISFPCKQDGLWVGVREDSSVFTANTLPGFLNCTRLGTLPGCLFKYDAPNEQCAEGREGKITLPRLVC